MRSGLVCILRLLAILASIASAHASVSEDPFFLSATMPAESVYAGQAINTSQIRSVVDITGTKYQGDVFVPDNYRLVANIYHPCQYGDFFIGLVPVDSVVEEDLMIEPFTVEVGAGLVRRPITLAHHMIAFKFSKPVILLAKVPDQLDFKNGIYHTKREHWLQEPIELHELTFSPQPAAPFGLNVNSIADGIFKNRVLALRLISAIGHSKGDGDDSSYNTRLIPLFKDSHLGRLDFLKVLDESTRVGMSGMYDVFTNRCDTVCFDVLGHSRPDLLSLASADALVFASGAIMYLVNKFQWVTRIFPSLAPLALKTRRWTSLGVEIRRLVNEPEYKYLSEKTEIPYCAAKLLGRRE